MTMLESYAVAILVVTPRGIPLVRDPKKPPPIFWKLPGGRNNIRETAEQCALRELEEEIGISLQEQNLVKIHHEDRETHLFVIFRVDLPALPSIKEEGNEGEEVRLFSPAQILAMQDFFPNHRRIVANILAGLAPSGGKGY